MTHAHGTIDEVQRLAALHGLRILDTSAEGHLDAVCRTAAELFKVPFVGVPLVDEKRLWFKARYGIDDECVDRQGAFCDHTITGKAGKALVVHDLRADPRFAASPLVLGAPYARFYAGVPFASQTGQNVGTLCLIDTVPRPDFGIRQTEQLQDFALIVQAHLRLHEAHLAREAETAERLRFERRLRAAQDSQTMAERTARFGHWRMDTIEQTVTWSEGIARIFGRNETLDVVTVERHLSFYHPDDCPRVRERIAASTEGRTIQDGGGYEHTSRIVRPDGEVRFVSVYGIAEHDLRGRVIALYGVCLDVTELSRSMQNQRETADLLRTTLETMSQGLLMLGPDERVRIHNRRVHDLLGLSDGLLFDGASFKTIRAQQLAAGEFKHASQQFRSWVEIGGLETESSVYERVRPDGSVIEVRAVPLAEGGVVRTFTDVTQRRLSEQAVHESERRYRLLAENTTDVIIWSELDTTRRYVSPAVRTVLGYEPQELVGTRPLNFVHPDDTDGYGRVLADLTEERIEQVITTQRYRHKTGRWVWIEVSFKLTRDPDDGSATGYVASLRDVTDRKAAEELVRLSEERLALALDSGSDGLWDWDLTSGAIQFSTHWFGMLGYGSHEIEPHIRSWHHLIHPEDAERSQSLLKDHVKGLTPTYVCEYRLRRKSGDYAWTLARGKVVARDANNHAIRMVGTHIDITARKDAEHQIVHMATHDALTDLPNRRLFRDRLEREIINAKRDGAMFAVLACDLDRFKAINDALGHPIGDKLLRIVADRLRSVTRDADTVARLGGDEFAMILSRLDNPQAASLAAQRVIEAVGQTIDLDGTTVTVGVSIGIVMGTPDCQDADSLFKNADIALYRAKATGRETSSFYESGMDAALASRSQLERDLREAVQSGRLVLHYQPIMNLADDAISGFEALLRWNHAERGMVTPGEFIPLAEETGLIVPLGAWALHEACREAARWPEELRIAVNVSVLQFQKPGLEQTIVTALAAAGLAPQRLELEITESLLLDDSEVAIACLHRLRGLGVRIALDDFGTGFSSLSYLRRFPFDKIKIDRSFVRDIGNPDTAAIVHAIVGIGKRLGSAITAEGVETDEQLMQVRREGCTEVQGFFYSKPVPAAEAAILAENLGFAGPHACSIAGERRRRRSLQHTAVGQVSARISR